MADKLIYYGDLKTTDGKYTDKDGKEKTRYVTLGKVYHSPHLSRFSIYMNPTAYSEGKWLNAYPTETYEKPTDDKDVIADVNDEPINLDNIPF